jgi:hypothetical protein
MVEMLINIIGYACLIGLLLILLMFIYTALHRGQKQRK